MTQSATPSDQLKKPLPEAITRLGWTLLLVGTAAGALAYSLDPHRSAMNTIVLFLFLASIAGGSIFLIAIEYIAGAVWSVPLRRVVEFFAGLAPLAPLAAVPVFFHLHDLYHWTHVEAVASDHLLEGKTPYLNIPFFVIRFLVVAALWNAFFFLFVRNSVKQDTTRDPRLTRTNIRLAAAFLPVFAITITVTAIDWAMSLEPHWYSTIYGVYYFAGTALAAVAAATLGVVLLSSNGYLPNVRRDHLYSLGALMFAFVNFWAYIAFSQFLLIWYANLPEETYWFMHRWEGGWQYFSILLITVHFVVPYFALLSQDAKMDPKRLTVMAIVVLIAHWMDLVWLVMPTADTLFTVGWIDLVFPFVAIGLGIVLVSFKVKRHSIVPIGDPKLERGLQFRL